MYFTVISMHNITEPRIDTGEALPVRLPHYHTPHGYHKIVQKELTEMDKDDSIECSSTKGAALTVLVHRNGTPHMCVDYCRLNSFSHVDPMSGQFD